MGVASLLAARHGLQDADPARPTSGVWASCLISRPEILELTQLTATILADCLARYPALSHVVIGLSLQVIVATALRIGRAPNPWWFGATATIAFYFSRKKLEIEHHVDPSGAHKAATWVLGWFPPQWPWPYQIQFYAPALAVICVALVASRRPLR